MAANPSFDIVSEVNLEEVQNAVNQSMVEIRQRFDFKNSKSDVTLDKGAHQMVLVSDDEVKMKSVIEVLQSKLARRQVSMKALEYGKIELASGGAVRQTVNIQQGIPQLKGKEIAKFIRGIGAKVQSQITAQAPPGRPIASASTLSPSAWRARPAARTRASSRATSRRPPTASGSCPRS